MSNNTTTKQDDRFEDDDRDLVGSFGYSSPTDMMREGLVRLILSGEEDTARELCERDGFSFAQAKEKAEARRRADRDEVQGRYLQFLG